MKHCPACCGTGVTPHGGICFPCGGKKTRTGPKKIVHRDRTEQGATYWMRANRYNHEFAALEQRGSLVLGYRNEAES